MEVNMSVLMPIELTNFTGTYIEHLNEDCLLEIFSNNSLTSMDLCSLAETCKRFKQITQRVFPKDYMIAQKYGQYEFQSKNGTNINPNLQDVDRVLKNFGSLLTNLKIGSTDQDLVTLVGMYCDDVTLNHLEISGFDCIEGVTKRMNSIFQRLRRLTLVQCHFLKDVSHHNFNFDSLIELEIKDSSGCVVILKQTFPNLERFSWHGSYVYGVDNNSASHLNKFIRRHGHLKTINLCGESVNRGGLLSVINSTCKKLENFIVDGDLSPHLSIDFSTPGGLSKLKALSLQLDYETNNLNNIALLQAVKFSLETLKLSSWNGWPRQIFDVLSQLQNLRELHMSLCPINRVPWKMLPRLRIVHLMVLDNEFNRTGLLNMIGQLTSLEELKYENLFNLSKEYFSEIVKLVERREHLLTIKCYSAFQFEENCNENQKVRFVQL